MITFIPITSIPLFGLNVSVHGLFMAFGVLTGYAFGKRRIKNTGLSADVFESVLNVAVVTGLIGARMIYIALFEPTATLGQIVSIWNGGLSSHGGYLFAIAASVVYLRWKKQDVLAYADALLPCMLIGWAVGRVGDFLSWGEFGVASSLPWAVSAFGTPRHPTQLYETLAYTISFVVVLWLGRRGKFKVKGLAAATSLLLFALSRFVIDFLRADAEAYRIFSQAITLTVIMACVAFIYKKVKCNKRV